MPASRGERLPDPPRPGHRLARWGLLRDLERPTQVFSAFTPNWYASIMGTGIVAVAAASLPVRLPGLRTAATAVWAVAAVLLVGLTSVTAVHWLTDRGAARRYLRDPVMAHFVGAAPMAMLTVGAGTLLLGRDVLGLHASVDVDWVLWFAGTASGLACAVTVPYLTFTTHSLRPDSPFAGWLMPIVPPMVSASTGALLLPYLPAGQLRLTMLLSCYAMFGLSLLASMIVVSMFWQRLTLHKTGPARLVPTFWIVLGPLGQSITAANLLGGNAHLALPAPYSTALLAFGVVYGVPVWGFALLWIGVAAAVTVRTARRHLPFSLTWWSFTFPIGTCVTGTAALAAHTGANLFRVAAAVFYAGLVMAWMIVAARTAHGSLTGRLLLPAQPAASTAAD